jgi:lysozyme family protein
MENKTIFDGFNLDGISYYYSRGKYYADNMTVREVISEKEYKDALMSKLIKGS